MRCFDITRELLSAPLYAGDTVPKLKRVQQLLFGDACNLTDITMCLHTGTHMDAPRHFIEDGASIDEIPPEVFCGSCRVVAFEGLLLGDEAERLVARYPAKRLLFKGDMAIDRSAAYVLADAGCVLLGVEGTSVSRPESTAAVHRHLLSFDCALLEGLDLSEVSPGEYFLVAAPIKVAGGDGAPVRALLFDSRDTLDVEPAFSKT